MHLWEGNLLYPSKYRTLQKTRPLSDIGQEPFLFWRKDRRKTNIQRGVGHGRTKERRVAKKQQRQLAPTLQSWASLLIIHKQPQLLVAISGIPELTPSNSAHFHWPEFQPTLSCERIIFQLINTIDETTVKLSSSRKETAYHLELYTSNYNANKDPWGFDWFIRKCSSSLPGSVFLINYLMMLMLLAW